MATNIDPGTRDILARCTITGKALHLPKQLPRADYLRVNKVIEALGGKWDRKTGSHIFDRDPLAVIEAAQRGQYSDEKKDLQQFDTPPMLATRMVDLADLRPGYQVLEPSAGIGMLVDVIAFRGADVTAIEISQERCRKLMGLPKRDGRISIYCADFTTWANLPVYPKGRTGFDAVIMNPPFAKAQDAVHIMTAWRLVRPGGRLVALASPTVRFNTQHIYQSFRKWLKRIEAETEDLPGGTFAESGTTVGAVLISATKPGREELVLGA